LARGDANAYVRCGAEPLFHSDSNVRLYTVVRFDTLI
jgi:hypothetical protein